MKTMLGLAFVLAVAQVQETCIASAKKDAATRSLGLASGPITT